MLFNSFSFLWFFPIVFVLYWFVTNWNLRVQNAMLLAVSYYFYASWDFRFLFLLVFSTLLDFFTGLKMQSARTNQDKRLWFWLSVLANLGFLGIFKYYDFFATSFASLLANFGWEVHVWTLRLILPVGISFYTFHGLSYVIDIYNNRIEPERNFITYALFVSYFPLLVAGPIERATHLLPQLKRKRTFSDIQAIEGTELVLWGFFKKIVIADNLAPLVNQVFEHSSEYNSSTLLIAALAFSFQIYGDFSGYSDIARGASKLLGIELLLNFNLPYLARNIAEFWRRWHISLSSWFRDYLYVPLGGSQSSKVKSIRNVFIIFLVSGFWHGANWTFIVWGAIHAIFFIPSFLLGSNRKFTEDIVSRNKPIPTFSDFTGVVFTFGLVTLAWIYFRAGSLHEANHYVASLFGRVGGKSIEIQNNDFLKFAFSFIAFFGFSLIFIYRKHNIIKYRLFSFLSSSAVLLIAIVLFGEFSEQSFIYFQF